MLARAIGDCFACTVPSAGLWAFALVRLQGFARQLVSSSPFFGLYIGLGAVEGARQHDIWLRAQNMRDHLGAIQEITEGIAHVDFSKIERGASRIGSSNEMRAMCTHMGAGAPGFAELALAFHRTADGIKEAASHHDMNDVLAKVNKTLDACTSCHATYKQQIVDDATWALLTERQGPH